MKRRTFIRNGLVFTSLACIPPELQPAGSPLPEDLVVKVSGESAYEITRRALAELGGMGKIIARRDVVLIKPNIGWNRTPEQAATTNPEVVGALVEMALQAGAAKVIVMDNPCHKAEDTYEHSGIAAVARKAGAEVRFADENRLVKYDFRGAGVKDWLVFQDFLEIDKFINVPILKHHASAEITIAMKNLYGILGGNRGKLHRDMGYNIADLAAGFKSHLVVVDAYRILRRNGPVGGRLSDVELKKTVIASTSIMNADTLATSFFGLEPAQLEFLQAAAERGLGSTAMAKIPLKTVAL